MLFAKVCSSTTAECDAGRVSNYFQELEQGAIKLSCQEKEHRLAERLLKFKSACVYH